MLATIVRKLWEAEGADPACPRMRRFYHVCLASHRWFHTYRDPLANGLVMVTHNWEAGRDNSSEWDDALARVDTSRVSPYQRRDTGHVDPAMHEVVSDSARATAAGMMTMLDFLGAGISTVALPAIAEHTGLAAGFAMRSLPSRQVSIPRGQNRF